jgi:probable F420-dependent oxidoreductase
MSVILSVGLPTGMEGLTYPIPFSDPEAVIRIAQYAEKLGYHSVWGNDHMTTQHYVRAEFPVPPRFWEPLVTYAFVAANTTTLRFGTGVLVLPMRRDIVVLAKQIATLDHFSGGRLEIGLGIGAYREEFAALWPDAGVHRGDMLEEGIKALRLLFSERVASFAGKYYRFRDVELYPKPAQPSLPIYIGGNSANHLRRVAQSADGWIPAAMAPDRLRLHVMRLKEMAEAAGRDPQRIAVAPQYVVHLGPTQDAAIARFRRSQMYKHLMSLRRSTLKEEAAAPMEEINLIGDAAAVAAKAEALIEAGVTHFLGLYFAADSVAELLDQMQIFAEEVGPRIAG